MRFFSVALAAMLTVATGTAFAQSQEGNAGIRPSGFSDDSIGYRYGSGFREPGVTDSRHANGIDIPKHILNLQHVDGGTMWSNFINVDFLFSSSRDPAAGGIHRGAMEVYAIYRGDLSLNQALHTNAFSVGNILQDVTLQIGGDINTKNTQFAPQKDLIVFGPDFHWNIPGGFLSTAFQVAHEWNQNGIVGKGVNFAPTWEIEAVWSVPLTFTRLPLSFEGFFNVVGPKGRDGFNASTKVEILTEPRLTLDVGALAFDRPHKLDLSIGYQYWLNKFGNNATNVPGSIASTAWFGVRYHF